MKRFLFRAYIIAVVLALVAISASILWRLDTLRESSYREATRNFQLLSREFAELWQTHPLEEAAERVAERLGRPARVHPELVSIAAFDHVYDYIWTTSERYLPGELDHPTPRGFIRFVRTFELPQGDKRIITAVYPLFPRALVFAIVRDALVAGVILLLIVALVALIHFVRTRKTPGPSERPVAATVAVREESLTPEPPAADRLLVEERFLPERLDSELERAGFSEQDLTLAILEFNQGVRGDEIDTQNSEALRNFFTFRDLCFEVDTRSAAVIIPNTSLGEALGIIERFQRYYWEQRAAWNRESADFYCGLASRAARLVDAERILKECRAALKRSIDTPGRIVGFQPDPGKYRDFISAQGKESA
ncbi:MAG: hypothetical protein EA427_08310 [Spirochaetaceae bacterium]|nr:MAG: hypothetical protein EA427_08310 [Spirochaetaceae bacterium]